MNPTPECTSLQQWSQVPQDLREGCKIALRLREHVFHTHGYHASVGVSRTKLLSRLLTSASTRSTRHVTVMPPYHVHAFMSCMPLHCIPALGGKAGAEVRQTLGVNSVGEIAKFAQQELADKFGAARARMLVALLEGGCLSLIHI